MENKIDYQTVELTNEEIADVTKALQDVLEKYDCEMQVISNIHILKRQKIDGITSPYGNEPTNKETNDTSEESSESTDGESNT